MVSGLNQLIGYNGTEIIIETVVGSKTETTSHEEDWIDTPASPISESVKTLEASLWWKRFTVNLTTIIWNMRVMLMLNV